MLTAIICIDYCHQPALVEAAPMQLWHQVNFDAPDVEVMPTPAVLNCGHGHSHGPTQTGNHGHGHHHQEEPQALVEVQVPQTHHAPSEVSPLPSPPPPSDPPTDDDDNFDYLINMPSTPGRITPSGTARVEHALGIPWFGRKSHVAAVARDGPAGNKRHHAAQDVWSFFTVINLQNHCVFCE